MIIKFTKLDPRAKMPTKAHLHDAAFDLTAVSMTYNDHSITYDTGIAVDIPPGYVGLVFQRSSVSKKSLILSNAVGVIDSGYSGPIKCNFKWLKDMPNDFYDNGDRIAQIMFIQLVPVIFAECESVEDFEHTTERGAGGYGSTGV